MGTVPCQRCEDDSTVDSVTHETIVFVCVGHSRKMQAGGGAGADPAAGRQRRSSVQTSVAHVRSYNGASTCTCLSAALTRDLTESEALVELPVTEQPVAWACLACCVPVHVFWMSMYQ